MIPILVISSLLCLFIQAADKPVRNSDWSEAEEKSANTVVQIIAQHTRFNWQEPYKMPKLRESSGTGFFLSKEGYIMTNFHVVDQAKSLQVYIPALGLKPHDAQIISVCPEADLAYLRLVPEGVASIKRTLGAIPTLGFGDSDLLFSTEPVLALGYPLGQRYLKSTVGVIAGREYIDGRSYMHMTAPINPGNSGGPLLDLDGKVVGINSAGIPGAQNIGYIIPSYDAIIILADLQKQKLVRKPRWGVSYNATTDEHAQFLKNPVPAGVYVFAVEKDTPAYNAGIRVGDMLYEINENVIDSYGDVTVNWQTAIKVTLEEFLVRLPSQTKLKIRLYRKGKEMSVEFDYVAPAPQPIRFVYADFEPEAIDYELLGGMCVMQLRLNHFEFFEKVTPLQQYKLAENQHQEVLIITRLLQGSVIHKINCFYEGAILAQVNGKPVKNLAQLRDAVKVSAQSGFLSARTKEGIETVVSTEALLKDEVRIAKQFNFASTQAMQSLKVAQEQKAAPALEK